MPPTRSANRDALESRRKIVRNRRTSPDDQIQRRLILRPDGRQVWQPAVNAHAAAGTGLPIPTELWIRLSEPVRGSHAGPAHALKAWDFARWLDAARAGWTGRKIEVYLVCFDSVSIKDELFDRLRVLADRRLGWPVRVLTDGRNIASTAVLDRLLRAAPDEVWVYLTGLGEPAINPRVLNAVKDLVDLRTARRQNLPRIIGRLCLPSAAPPKLRAEVTAWAKQAGIDRLDVTDKETEEQKLWAL